MKSNRKYTLIFSTDTSTDLENIYIYTANQWGVSQAKKYRQELTSKLELLEATPFIGTKAEAFSLPVYQLQILKHTAYYQVRDDTILILRILHQNRDVEAD